MVTRRRPSRSRKRKPDTLELLTKKRDVTFKRFPLALTLLATFGLVSIYYGFQHFIDRIAVLANNPILPLGMGILILLFTGTLYKKLG